MFAEAASLMAPAACCLSSPSRKFLHDRIRLAGSVMLGGGPVVEVIGGAEAPAVAVVTVGSVVDRRLKQMQEAGQRFQALVLDEAGLLGGGSGTPTTGRPALLHVYGAAGAPSTFLSPGRSAWSVRDNAIFKLVDAGAIGVSLSPAVMTPMKSLSLVWRRRKPAAGRRGLTNCDFCSIRDRCGIFPQRHARSIPLKAATLT